MNNSLGTLKRRLPAFGVAAAVAVLTALGGTTVASAAEGSIVNAGSDKAIKDSYIVVLKDGSSVEATAKSVTQRHGGTVEKTFASSVRGFSGALTEKQAKRVAADPAVAYVEQNQTVSVSADQLNPPSWGLDRVDQQSLPLNQKYSYSTTASNVTAYVVDTGILTTHPDFGGRATHGRDTVDNDNDATDCQGHGTHVAGDHRRYRARSGQGRQARRRPRAELLRFRDDRRCHRRCRLGDRERRQARRREHEPRWRRVDDPRPGRPAVDRGRYHLRCRGR